MAIIPTSTFVTKVSVKNFNADKLKEELAALPVTSIFYAGFIALNERVKTPFPEANRVIGYAPVGGRIAASGELRVVTHRPLDQAEDNSLTAIIAAHDATLRTAEQASDDQDSTDLDDLIATERAAYQDTIATFATALDEIQTRITGKQTIISSWDAATTAEKLVLVKNYFTLDRQSDVILRESLEAIRQDFITLGKLARIQIRRERGVAI